MKLVADNASEALSVYRALPDVIVARAEYRANRPLGRMVKDHDEVRLQKKQILDPVEDWAKAWITEA